MHERTLTAEQRPEADARVVRMEVSVTNARAAYRRRRSAA
jgi:hypothetical protein